MPSTTSKNLGQVAAVIPGATAPANTNVIWLDTSGDNTVKKIYDPNAGEWIPLTQAGTVAGDNWGTQVVEHSDEFEGKGTADEPLIIAQQGATTGQVLKWNGTKWEPDDDDTGDGIETVSHTDELTGDGTTGSLLGIAQQGATSGQVLKWNGAKWAPGNDNIGVEFTPGMIMMWCGNPSNVPAGWALCNGQGNLSTGQPVPDLRGMFVVGYNPSDTDYNAIGKTGGAKTVSLTAAQNGPHTHGVNDPGHSHSFAGVVSDGRGADGGKKATAATLQTGTSITNISIQQSGSGQPHENRPPYYTLAYIVKL